MLEVGSRGAATLKGRLEEYQTGELRLAFGRYSAGIVLRCLRRCYRRRTEGLRNLLRFEVKDGIWMTLRVGRTGCVSTEELPKE